jgi:hypothetical protein
MICSALANRIECAMMDDVTLEKEKLLNTHDRTQDSLGLAYGRWSSARHESQWRWCRLTILFR